MTNGEPSIASDMSLVRPPKASSPWVEVRVAPSLMPGASVIANCQVLILSLSKVKRPLGASVPHVESGHYSQLFFPFFFFFPQPNWDVSIFQISPIQSQGKFLEGKALESSKRSS